MALTLAEVARLDRREAHGVSSLMRWLTERHTWRDQTRVRGRFAEITAASCTVQACLLHKRVRQAPLWGEGLTDGDLRADTIRPDGAALAGV